MEREKEKERGGAGAGRRGVRRSRVVGVCRVLAPLARVSARLFD